MWDRLEQQGAISDQHAGRRPVQESVRQALQTAAKTRANTGEVNRRWLRALMDSLPAEIQFSEANLSNFAADVLQADRNGIAIRPVREPDAEGAKGISGVPVYFVVDETGRKLGVAKVFLSDEEFARELSALERLAHESFDKAQTVKVLGVARAQIQNKMGGALVASLAPGQALDDLMLQASQNLASGLPESRLWHAVKDTARALAELHTRPVGSGGQVSPHYIQRHARALRDIALKLTLRLKRRPLKKLGGADRLQQRVDDLIANFAREPGGAALVHGDAHPGNFFYAPTGATLIDLATMHWSLNARGYPIGTPARDTANFAQKLYHFGRQFGFPHSTLQDLQTSFLDAYQISGQPIPHAAWRFFQARSALGEILKIASPLDALPEDQSTPVGTIAELLDQARNTLYGDEQ